MEGGLAQLAPQIEQKKEEPQPIILQCGQVVQGHEIIKPLGKGKFSVVYKAKRLSDGFLCALKKINIFDIMQPKQRDKCMKEVRLLQSLDHPNIVKLFEAIVNQSELLIIVDWAERGDLKRMIRKAQHSGMFFKESQIWEYSKQLAGALEHMHSKRIMHRDLKPANIFVSQDGSLKLGDLGLGRVMSSFTLEAFSKVGTPLYMSPEVLHGAGYDMRSDVWSLGCVLYELVMLRSPFKSDQQLSLYDLFVRISKGEYPPLSEATSTEFRDLVGRMLELEPAKRPDAAQVRSSCVAHIEGKADAAKSSPARAERAAPQSRPSPLLVMDDIVEKLKLLDCEERLLRPRGYPILNRCFFVQQVSLPSKLTQFEVMYELCRWLLSLSREREELDRCADRGGPTRVVGSVQPTADPDASAGPSYAGAAPAADARQAHAAAGQVVPRRPPGAAAMGRRPHPSASVASAAAAGGRGVGQPPDGAHMGAGDAAAGGCGVPLGDTGRAIVTRIDLGVQPRVRPEDVAELADELVVELHGRGLAVHGETTRSQLQQGFGETVCSIINELINQELVGRDFHFESPDWDVDSLQEGEGSVEDEEISEDARCSSSPSASEHGCEVGDIVEEHICRLHSEHPGLLPEPISAGDEVDREAWEQELQRVRPKLQAPSRGSYGHDGWRSSVETAKSLCRRIVEDLGPPGRLAGRLDACRERWRDELDRLRQHEDRINGSFRHSIAELSSLRRDISQESGSMEALHGCVTEMVGKLASVSRELEAVRSTVSEHSEALQDQERVMELKKALQRLKDDDRQLSIRLACVRHDLSQRECRRSVGVSYADPSCPQEFAGGTADEAMETA